MKAQETEFRQQLLNMLPKLKRYCYAQTGEKHSADDLMQSSVEKALRRWHQYQPGTEFERWMYRLCRNHWIDTMRTEKISDELNDDMMVASEIENPEQQALTQAALRHMQIHFNALSEGLRMVLYLVAVEGRSYQEAADILDIPAGTVMSRLARARKQLAEASQR
jgi:RNA polymerase sigma-70 factor (ECF subfamily)